jgi:putative ABC transport system permease protein
MFRLTIKEIAANKRRLLATVLAVILGVAFLAGTRILTDTITGTLDQQLVEAEAGTDAYVRGSSPLDPAFRENRPPIDAALADTIARVDGVDAVALRVTGYAQILDKSGKAVGSPQNGVVGTNWTPVTDLNPFLLAAGRAPTGPDEIVIDKHSADQARFAVGDQTTVLSIGGPRPATIVGIARFGAADTSGSQAVVLFDDATAQSVLGAPGQLDGIAVTAQDGVSPETLVANLAPIVGSDDEVLTGAQLTQANQRRLHKDIAAFGTFMMVFAGIALFVGAFIINNTFAILVSQRTRQLALLRAIGASARQVRRAVLIEAALIGLTASAIGLGVGFVVARSLLTLMRAIGLQVPPGSTVVTLSTVVVAVAAGFIVTLVSAVLPSRQASKVPPVAAMREVAVDHSAVSKGRIITGLVATALSISAVAVGIIAADPRIVGLGGAGLFLGVSVLGPVLARPVAAALGYPMARLRGMSGVVAQQNAMRNPKRTARTAASLMIGVGLVSFITIFAASIKASGAGALRTDYQGTAVVDSGAIDATMGLSPAFAADLRTRPGVRTVAEERLAKVEIDGTPNDYFRAYDVSAIGTLFNLGHVEGNLDQLGIDGMAVKAGAGADAPHLGDTHLVTFLTGTRTFTVRAIYDNGADLLGNQFVDLAAFDANLPAQPDSRVYVDADNLDAVALAAAPFPTAKVLDTEAFIIQQGGQIDTILKLIDALLGLAVIIALLGIANTLSLSINERKRELGLLRAVGMSRSQIRASVRWESVIVALFGTTLGLSLGAFLGWAMMQTLTGQGINRFVIPVDALAVITGIAALAGIAAAVMPARRAARIEVLTAIAGS